MVSRLGFVTAPKSLSGGHSNFARCLAIYGLVHYIHFWGLLPPDGILTIAKFTLHLSLAFCNIGSVTARHSSSGCQPNCGMVSSRDRAAIPFDIGQLNCLACFCFPLPLNRHHRSKDDCRKGKIIRFFLCSIVCNSCAQCNVHTYEQS